MKKQTLKSLSLNKKVISELKGGADTVATPLTVKSCPPEVPASWFPRCHSKYNPCPMW
ncbi:hypothetical protein [Kordia sp.]|uniref:hypothetical protein n=1 Tax=Kordia sp. TaxID=1965332 RepID=UPI003D2B776A